MKPAILHVDMDAFFASVEQREHPEYQGKPVIVGGSREKRGVVSTASYEARVYGVHSAMPMAEAVRLCPNGIFLPVDMQLYHKVSGEIMTIFKQYTPEVEAISVDEAFLDVTGSQKLFGTAEEIGWKIKKQIREELHLTASVGLSYNKFLAKLASDYKKPDGYYIILPEELEEKVWPLSVRRMMGVGAKTAETLEKMGVKTIGSLAKLDVGLLNTWFGKQGKLMHDLANGVDYRRVEPIHEAKSMGREITFAKDITDHETLETVLFTLTDEVCRSLRQNGIKGKTVSVKIKYPDLHQITRAITLERYTSGFDAVYGAVKKLFRENVKEGTPVRLIGMNVSHLEKEDAIIEQQDLFTDGTNLQKKGSLDKIMDQINQKYGGDTVKRARKMKQYGKNEELSQDETRL